MDEDVAELARGERLVEGAELATARGDFETASTLYERACLWGMAAQAAAAQGAWVRALRLGATAGREGDSTAEAALAKLTRDGATSGPELLELAVELGQRGLFAWAARVYTAAGANDDAALAFDRAGDGVSAARVLEAGNNGSGAVRAARVLEAGLRREPDRADLQLALGGLLLRSGKPAAALRVVQRVPAAHPRRVEAFIIARDALAELGMNDARAEVLTELAASGGAAPAREPLVAALPRPIHRATSRLYGRYEVLREVSSTATARLVECRDTLNGERVAVKVFSAHGQATRGTGRDALAHFSREARALARLANPNIVPLREVLEQGPALVLAWMPGGTLEDHLQTEAFTPARAVRVGCAILRALGEAHRIGVVHRDVKPANILFDAAGQARLSDFGAAHLSDLSTTATAGVFGSLAYMSPEQRGGRPATARSDLYGLGIVLIEMLTGFRGAPSESEPDSAANRVRLASYHRRLGPRHDELVRTLVARDPSARPSDAFTAARALESIEWPDEADANAPRGVVPRGAPPSSAHPPPERLDVAASGATDAASVAPARDRWLERAIARVTLTERILARAAAFARVHHRALQTVLRVDREGGCLWLGVPRGARLARPLEASERSTLETVLSLLHAEGVTHGRVAANEVVIGDDGPVLLFGGDEPYATEGQDWAALAKL